MEDINKVKSISLWIFIVPFVAVNTCLILITQFHSLFPNQENVILNTSKYLFLTFIIVIITHYSGDCINKMFSR